MVVAILDDGLDFNHPDLAANAFVNTGEIANNGIDDDNNGYIDDRRGWDFATGLPGDNDPSVDAPDDAHGIAVTGIIAARGNNNVGVAGVAYNTRWFTARIFEGPVSTDDLTIAAAINYASGRPGPTGGGGAGAAIPHNTCDQRPRRTRRPPRLLRGQRRTRRPRLPRQPRRHPAQRDLRRGKRRP